MSQFQNETATTFLSEVEKKLYQWYSLDQQHLLEAQLGLDGSSFLDFLAGQLSQNEFWTDEVKPGSVPGTLLEKFKQLDYSGVNFNKRQFRKELVAYPFTFFKEGANFDPDDPTAFLQPNLKGATFSNINLDYPFAPFSEFTKVDFENAHIQHFYFHKSIWKNATITDSKFIDGEFNDLRYESGASFENFGEVDNCFIRNSHFDRLGAYNVLFRRCLIQNSEFVFSDLRFEKDRDDIFDCNIYNTLFNGCTINIHHNNIGKEIIGNEFIYTFFRSMSSGRNNLINCLCVDNDFKSCHFWDLEIDGYFQENSFYGSYFRTAPTFSVNAIIDGCDFTGTNLDDYYTMQEVKDTVYSWNSDTLWVDGTPF